jgi:uncharacterized protein (DUF1697 family)
MQRWIALFRGINVGGNHILPMRELVQELEALKLKNVRTYIQSGNAVFDGEQKNAQALAKQITQRIEKRYGFAPHVLIISRKDLHNAVDANPFPAATSEPKSLHVFFLDKLPAKPNLTALDLAKKATEAYQLNGSVFYLHAPDGIGRSKLAASAERHLGVAATARNYRTVEKLVSLADQT